MPQLSSANLNYLNSTPKIASILNQAQIKEVPNKEKKEDKSLKGFASKNGTTILNLALLGASTLLLLKASKISQGATELANKSEEIETKINNALQGIVQKTNQEIETKINNALQGIVQKANQEIDKTKNEAVSSAVSAINTFLGSVNKTTPQTSKVDLSAIENKIQTTIQSGIDKFNEALAKALSEPKIKDEKTYEALIAQIIDKSHEKTTSEISDIISKNLSNLTGGISEEKIKEIINDILTGYSKKITEISTNVQNEIAATAQKEIKGISSKGQTVIEEIAAAITTQTGKEIERIANKGQETIEGIQSSITGQTQRAIEGAKTAISANVEAGINKIQVSATSALEDVLNKISGQTTKEITPQVDQVPIIKKLDEIIFEKGMAYLKGTKEKFNGIIQDITKKGKQFEIKYNDGQMRESKIGNIIKRFTNSEQKGILSNVVEISNGSDVSFVRKTNRPLKRNPEGLTDWTSSRFLIDHKNKIKREIFRFNIKDSILYKIAATDGEYGKVIRNNDPSSEVVSSIIKYNSDKLTNGFVGLPQGGCLKGQLEPRPSFIETKLTVGKDENGKRTITQVASESTRRAFGLTPKSDKLINEKNFSTYLLSSPDSENNRVFIFCNGKK